MCVKVSRIWEQLDGFDWPPVEGGTPWNMAALQWWKAKNLCVHFHWHWQRHVACALWSHGAFYHVPGSADECGLKKASLRRTRRVYWRSLRGAWGERWCSLTFDHSNALLLRGSSTVEWQLLIKCSCMPGIARGWGINIQYNISNQTTRRHLSWHPEYGHHWD